MIHFFSAARGADLKKIVKGTLPATEFYGIVSPEYDPGGSYANRELLGDLRRCDRLVIAGEARDYCVAQSVLQICEAMEKEKKRPEIFIMEDCMSCVGSDTAAVAAAYGAWSGQVQLPHRQKHRRFSINTAKNQTSGPTFARGPLVWYLPVILSR